MAPDDLVREGSQVGERTDWVRGDVGVGSSLSESG